MVEFRQGDLFAAQIPVMVNPCNCLGSAGAGLSQQFKLKFPAYYADYRAATARGLEPGQVHVWENPKGGAIVSFPTKRDWRAPSKIEWIASGLVALQQAAESRKWEAIACPALGCGLGRLRWKNVKEVLEQWDSNTKLVVFEPFDLS